MYSAEYFGRQLKKALSYHSIPTQSIFARIIGYNRQPISLWILGKRTPSLKKLIEISDLLKLRPDFFFLDADPEDFIIGPLDNRVTDILKEYFPIDITFKEVIIVTRNNNKKEQYRKFCERHNIKYSIATCTYSLESLLKTCKPDGIYWDMDLPFSIKEDIKIIKI